MEYMFIRKYREYDTNEDKEDINAIAIATWEYKRLGIGVERNRCRIERNRCRIE